MELVLCAVLLVVARHDDKLITCALNLLCVPVCAMVLQPESHVPPQPQPPPIYFHLQTTISDSNWTINYRRIRVYTILHTFPYTPSSPLVAYTKRCRISKRIDTREHAVRCSVNARYLLFKFSKVIKHDDKRIHFNINFIHWKCLFNSNKNTMYARVQCGTFACGATGDDDYAHNASYRWCLAGGTA